MFKEEKSSFCLGLHLISALYNMAGSHYSSLNLFMLRAKRYTHRAWKPLNCFLIIKKLNPFPRPPTACSLIHLKLISSQSDR